MPCSTHVRSKECAPRCAGTSDEQDARVRRVEVDQAGSSGSEGGARANPRDLFQDVEADDRARHRTRHRAAEESSVGGRARQGRGLHGRPGADAERMGPRREEEATQETAMNEQPRRFLQRVWASVRQPGLTPGRAADNLIDLCHALLSEIGEVSGARIAAEAIAAYRQLNDPGRELFFTRLAEQFRADAPAVEAAIATYRADPSPGHLATLHRAAEPVRQELFRRLNTAAGGTATLVQMRADLLKTLKEHPEREAVDADLVHLFRSWFNRGFLTMQRIDWRTSALILERLIQYEAVHQIQDWSDQ